MSHYALSLLPVPTQAYEDNEDEAGYEMVEQPCAPTPTASSKPRRLSSDGRTSSSRSSPSKSTTPANEYNDGRSAQKRKASLSQESLLLVKVLAGLPVNTASNYSMVTSIHASPVFWQSMPIFYY